MEHDLCESEPQDKPENHTSKPTKSIETNKTLVQVKKKPIDYSQYRAHFLGVPIEKIKATFQATAQFATNVMAGNKILQTIKSPWPANNVRRRNEPVATDTIKAQVPAVDDGSTMAQLFIGRKSLVSDAHGVKTDAAFVNTLEDNMRQRGAMDKLISDGAQAELSDRAKGVLRALCLDDWHIEAHYQHQNFAEHRWRHIKKNVEWLMNLRNCPPEVWLLALQCVCGIMNHTAEKSLGNRPPLQILEGHTIDISILLYFLFWDIVYVSRVDDKDYHRQIGSKKSSLVRGRMVGFAWNVGHGLTYKVLTDDTQWVICRSQLCLASDAKNQVEEVRHMQPRNDRFFLDSKHDFDDPSTTLPTLEAFDCPFVDEDDNKSSSAPTINSPPNMRVNGEEDRGANAPPNKGSHPEVATLDECDARDGTLRPGFDSDRSSPRCLIEDHRIAKMYPHGTKLKKRFNNGRWYPGTVVSGPYQFDDEMPVTPRWEIVIDDGDRAFLMVDELQYCQISHRPTHADHLTPTVETVTKDNDDDTPYSSPMDDMPLDQRPEIMFPDKDEDLPPHLREPRPYGAPNPKEIPRDFSGQTLCTDNPVLPNLLPPNKMLDCTFLMQPEDDGTRYRAKIIALIDNHLAENNFEKQPERIKFKCLVNDQHEEIVAYNDIVDYMEADDTWDGVWKFRRILDHKHVKPSNKNYMQCSVNVLIEWESDETSWRPLHRKDKAGI